MLPHESPSDPNFRRRSAADLAIIAAESSSASVKRLFSPPPPMVRWPALNQRAVALAGFVPRTSAAVFSRVAFLDG